MCTFKGLYVYKEGPDLYRFHSDYLLVISRNIGGTLPLIEHVFCWGAAVDCVF